MIQAFKRQLKDKKAGLQSRTILAAFWSLIGSGGAGIIRFTSNLVLTRLLFPEAFGLMATAMLMMTLVQIFSDTGVKTALIQHPQGDSRSFIDTSFIIALGRSILLFLILIISVSPIANFYSQPELVNILWVMSIAFLAEGFLNPALPLLIKKLRIEKQVVYSIGTQLAGFLTTLALVYVLRSVLALAIGYVFTSIFRVIGSYLILSYRPKFKWNRAAGLALLHFGKYIIVNTMIGWAVLNLDRMVIGKVLGMEQLGFYNIALFIGVFVSEVLVQIFSQSYFPAVSTIAHNHAKVQMVFEKANATIIALVAPFVMLLVMFSNEVISILYDPRYLLAGTVLFWISIRSLIQMISNIQSGTLLAMGKPVFVTISNGIGLVFLSIALPLLTTKYGLAGSGMAVVLSSLIIGLAQTISLLRYIQFTSRSVLMPWMQLGLIMFLMHVAYRLLYSSFHEYSGYNLAFILLMFGVATIISLINIWWLNRHVFNVKIVPEVA